MRKIIFVGIRHRRRIDLTKAKNRFLGGEKQVSNEDNDEDKSMKEEITMMIFTTTRERHTRTHANASTRGLPPVEVLLITGRIMVAEFCLKNLIKGIFLKIFACNCKSKLCPSVLQLVPTFLFPLCGHK